MSGWLKYGVIITTFAAPYALYWLFQEGQDFVYGLIPGVLVWYLFLLMEIKERIEARIIVRKRLGMYDIAGVTDGINVALENLSVCPDSIFLKSAYERIKEFGYDMEQASKGIIALTQDERLRALPIDLAESVKKTLDATLIWAEDDLRAAFGGTYARTLADAVSSKGVKTRRLFIYECEKSVDREAMRRMREDSKNGIEVKMIMRKSWCGKGGPLDFGIWDGTLVWEYRPVTGNRRSAFLKRGAEVDRFKQLFEANWYEASPLLSTDAT